MMAYDPDTKDNYCDLQCFACPGLEKVPCLLNDKGLTMRKMMFACLGYGKMLTEFKPSSKHWQKYFSKVLTMSGYPIYTGEMEH